MFVTIFTAPGKATRTAIGNIVHGWSSGADRNAYLSACRKAGVKVVGPVTMTAEGFDAFTESHLRGQDFDGILAALGRVDMRAAALVDIESREEQRDTAGPDAPPAPG